MTALDRVRTAMTLDDRLDDITQAHVWSRIEGALTASPPRRARWQLAALGAAAAAIAILVLARRSDVTETLTAPANTTLSAHLGPHTRAALVGPARLEVVGAAGDTTAIRLRSGTLLAEFAGGTGRSLRIDAPGATVEIVGTVFAVEVVGNGSCISVSHGTVRVIPARGAQALVTAGRRWCTADARLDAIPPALKDALEQHAIRTAAAQQSVRDRETSPPPPAVTSEPTRLAAAPPIATPLPDRATIDASSSAGAAKSASNRAAIDASSSGAVAKPGANGAIIDGSPRGAVAKPGANGAIIDGSPPGGANRASHPASIDAASRGAIAKPGANGAIIDASSSGAIAKPGANGGVANRASNPATIDASSSAGAAKSASNPAATDASSREAVAARAAAGGPIAAGDSSGRGSSADGESTRGVVATRDSNDSPDRSIAPAPRGDNATSEPAREAGPAPRTASAASPVRDPGAPDELYRAAERALATHDLTAADRALAQITERQPGSPLAAQALYERARIAYQQHAWARAQRQLDKLAALGPTALTEPGAYLGCRIAVAAGDDGAERCFVEYRAAYPRSPHDLDVLGVLVDLAYRAGGCARSAGLRDELGRRYPESPLARGWAGRCQEHR